MSKKEEKIKIYDVTLEDWEEGVFATSLVEKPAIGSDFKFFSAETDTIIHFADEEKREVVGAVMIPDILIPRKFDNGEIYYVRFSKEIIAGLNERMKDYGYDKSFTFAHSYSAGDNVKLLESWIKEFDEDKSNSYGFDLPIGTMFMKVKIEEDTLWNLVKEKKLKGFSIELNASYRLNEKESQYSKVDLFDNKLVVSDYTLLWFGDNVITEDSVLFNLESTITENGDQTESVHKFTGEFEMDGKMYKSENGRVVIKEKEEDADKKEIKMQELIDKVSELMNAKFDEIKESIKNEIKEDNNKLSESLEEVKLFQKQNTVVKEKEEFNEVKVDMKENIETLDEWYNKLK